MSRRNGHDPMLTREIQRAQRIGIRSAQLEQERQHLKNRMKALHWKMTHTHHELLWMTGKAPILLLMDKP